MKDLLEYTGLFSAFLLLCGVIKFYIYYKSFGVSILRFIDLSEILTLFMDNIIAYLSIIIPTTICLFLIYHNSYNKILNTNLAGYYILFQEWLIWTVLLAISIIGTFLYFIFNKGVSKRELALLISLILTCILGIPLLYIYSVQILVREFGITLSFTPVYLMTIAMTLLAFSILAAKNEAYKVKNRNFFAKTEINFNNGSSIISSANFFYIGMTKNFCFFFNKIDETCSVYKVDEITSLKFIKRSKRIG